MTDFARPMKELLDSGIPNTVDPAAGMGLTLDEKGNIPVGVSSLSFLQLAVAGIHAVNFGTTTLTWPGGSVFGNFITITHGLGATPAAILATPAGGAGLTQDPLVVAFTAGATTFQLRGETIDGQNPLNTATSSAYWLAIS